MDILIEKIVFHLFNSGKFNCELIVELPSENIDADKSLKFQPQNDFNMRLESRAKRQVALNKSSKVLLKIPRTLRLIILLKKKILQVKNIHV